MKFLRKLLGLKTEKEEPKAHRVLILGAGASRAQWIWEQADKPTETKIPPPLNADFFEIASRIDGELTNDLLKEIQERWSERKRPTSSVTSLTMEEAFDFVFEDALEHPEDSNCRLLYGGLQSLIVSVIAHTTNTLCLNSSGPIDELLFYSLKAPHVGRITVITFNYDLLVERSLTSLAKADAHNFGFSHFYGLPFSNIPTPPVSSGNDNQMIRVLKPQGSLNWMINSRYAMYLSELNRLAELKRLDLAGLEVFHDLEIPLDENNRFDQQRFCLDRLKPKWPFLMPPTRAMDKIRLPWLRRQNEAVSEAIGSANEIVVFGYSFQEANPLSQSILSMLSNTENPQRIVVVDPADKVLRLVQSNTLATVKCIPSIHEMIWSLSLTPFADGS